MDRRCVIAMFLLFLAVFGCGAIHGHTICEHECIERTQTAAGVEQGNEGVEPRPLVIETKDDEPFGTYTGTATIISPYNDSECWAGLILIQRDGPDIRVTVMDAVESQFDEHF